MKIKLFDPHVGIDEQQAIKRTLMSKFWASGQGSGNVSKFEKNNVKLIFQDYNHPKYSQLYSEFVSHLSIIDLPFNHGPKSLEIILSNNISQKSIIS